jgi:uncharacterized iron-regulated membrane protein
MHGPGHLILEIVALVTQVACVSGATLMALFCLKKIFMPINVYINRKIKEFLQKHYHKMIHQDM